MTIIFLVFGAISQNTRKEETTLCLFFFKKKTVAAAQIFSPNARSCLAEKRSHVPHFPPNSPFLFFFSLSLLAIATGEMMALISRGEEKWDFAVSVCVVTRQVFLFLFLFF